MEAVAAMADRAKGVIDKPVLCAWNDRALFLFFLGSKNLLSTES